MLTGKLKRYEKKKREQLEKYKILTELKKQYGVEEVEFQDKIRQYSKILTTSILVFIIVLDLLFFITVLASGALGIDSGVIASASSVINPLNLGTIVFFCGYFAKSLFETKWEKENETDSSAAETMVSGIADAVVTKVKDTLS